MIPYTGFAEIKDRSRKQRGAASPIQILDVPDDNDAVWETIPPMHKSKLHSLAVFDTHSEFAALIGFSINAVTQALYNARRGKKNDEDKSALIKGFRIVRLEDNTSK